VVEVGGRAVARSVYEPGWKWSVNVKPRAGTDTCEIFHLGYVISGRIKVTMDDGEEAIAGPGMAFSIPPGHTGEVVGDEPCVWVDFGDVGNYGKPAG
jgi:mannose-6-phosphate isomerase-like protein (cupin superfamily)